MRFYCIDTDTGNQVFHYIDKGEEKVCDNCIEITYELEKTQACKKNRYFASKLTDDNKYMFCFCLKGIKTKKQAKPIIKQTINAFINSREVAINISAMRLTANDLAIHNTKNLHAEINNKLLSLFNEEQLSEQVDKISFIEKAMLQDPRKFAREILSVLKSTSQIMHEYNIIDFVAPSTRLQRADFGYHRAHTLCVMCFYLYELEFKEKKIKVTHGQSIDNIYINWGTARTAVSQIFDNCLKYCKPDSDLKIDFIKKKYRHLEIVFEMTSLYFSAEEATKLTLPNYRSKYAKTLSEGKGAGMAIVQRMMQLNEGALVCQSFEKKKYYSGETPYSTNRFILSFRL